jgi:hypothetical protein
VLLEGSGLTWCVPRKFSPPSYGVPSLGLLSSPEGSLAALFYQAVIFPRL